MTNGVRHHVEPQNYDKFYEVFQWLKKFQHKKEIAKKAKARGYKGNLEAITLYQILTNIGGEFSMIMRHMIEEYGDIEHGDEQESFAFLSWLPHHLNQWLIQAAENGLIKASFVTNS